MSNFCQVADKEIFNSIGPIESLYPDLAQHTVSNATVGEQDPQSGISTRVLYWYHPDYVGNVDLVTDLNQEAYEFYLYNPWGESLYHWESGSSSWNSPYRFNSKEFDAETEMHYSGARYYDNKAGIWISVDPMVHKRSWVSPYNFVQNNPINRIDPTGALDSIIITNNNDKVIGRIKLDNHKNVTVKLDTDFSTDNPLTIDGDKILQTTENIDAISLSLTYAGLVGGGMDMSLNVTHFLNGKDAGSTFLYSNVGGGVGLDGEVTLSASYATFNKFADNSKFDAKGFAGQYTSQSFGGTIGNLSAGLSRTWGNVENLKGELYRGHKSTTTWTNYEIATPLTKGGFRAGGRMVWGESKILHQFE